MTILSKAIYTYHAFQMKIPTLLMEMGQIIQKFIWKNKWSRVLEAILSNNKNSEGINNLNSKYYCITILIQQYGMTLAQWTKTEDLNMDTQILSYMILDKDGKKWRKDNIFNKWQWENWISTCRRTTFWLLIPVKNINSKWIDETFNTETAQRNRPYPLRYWYRKRLSE